MNEKEQHNLLLYKILVPAFAQTRRQIYRHTLGGIRIDGSQERVIRRQTETHRDIIRQIDTKIYIHTCTETLRQT